MPDTVSIVPETPSQASGSADLGAAVVYFAKAPRAGAVKTRLCPPLTPAEAAGIYRGFLADVVRPLPGAVGYCYVWPADGLQEVAEIVGDAVELRAQRGADLWERMAACFRELFDAGHTAVVLRNTDSPDLPDALVLEAIAECAPGRVVLGPDRGGGYYLIGVASVPDRLLGVDAEGGTTVFRTTVARAEDAGLEVVTLREWRDVDVFADLLDVWRARES